MYSVDLCLLHGTSFWSEVLSTDTTVGNQCVSESSTNIPPCQLVLTLCITIYHYIMNSTN